MAIEECERGRVDLISIGGPPPDWPLGRSFEVGASPREVAALMERLLPGNGATAWLFWDVSLGPPDPARIHDALGRPGDAWHCGPRLGTLGLPRIIDHVMPNWMFTCDASPDVESTSWRFSLRACLIRVEAIRALGVIRPDFRTLDAAALEMGYRYIRNGVLPRHVPGLLAPGDVPPSPPLPFEDEVRWAALCAGRFWASWAAWRSVAIGRVGPFQAAAALGAARASDPPAAPLPFIRIGDERGRSSSPGVTVLVPTLDRYPYLLTLLDQLGRQTVPPVEVIVVDQTERSRRRDDLAERFPGLPLKVFQLDRAGQCSSRNLGLKSCRGEYVLFLDDDDEIPPDLLESHLNSLARHAADSSSGAVDEADGTRLPADFTRFRASDVFPTNNTLVRLEALRASGLFDLAYDRGARADGDLGMRLYLSGARMVYDPAMRVVHHHAPSGGLRVHKARTITYGASRRSLVLRHLASPTELYLGLRYFTRPQVREVLWINALRTFHTRGGAARRLAKVAIGAAQLPSTLARLWRSRRKAGTLAREFPRIDTLPAAAVAALRCGTEPGRRPEAGGSA